MRMRNQSTADVTNSQNLERRTTPPVLSELKIPSQRGENAVVHHMGTNRGETAHQMIVINTASMMDISHFFIIRPPIQYCLHQYGRPFHFLNKLSQIRMPVILTKRIKSCRCCFLVSIKAKHRRAGTCHGGCLRATLKQAAFDLEHFCTFPR